MARLVGRSLIGASKRQEKCKIKGSTLLLAARSDLLRRYFFVWGGVLIYL